MIGSRLQFMPQREFIGSLLERSVAWRCPHPPTLEFITRPHFFLRFSLTYVETRQYWGQHSFAGQSLCPLTLNYRCGTEYRTIISHIISTSNIYDFSTTHLFYNMANRKVKKEKGLTKPLSTNRRGFHWC